jgi:hypothetical protein
MGNAQLWRRAGPAVDMDEDRLNSAAVLGGWIAGLVRSAEHDNALMSPKLLSKARVTAESASADTGFQVRAVAAQIGWLETCIPVVAAQAVTDIKLLLSSGAPAESIHHQLRVFEAYVLGCSPRGKRRTSSSVFLERLRSRHDEAGPWLQPRPGPGYHGAFWTL